MIFPLAAQLVAPTPQQQRAWLVTLILASLLAFLCVLLFLLAMRLFRRGKRRRLVAGPTPSDSVWAAAGGRVPADEDRPPADGALEDPVFGDSNAEEEPFWDAEDEAPDDDDEDDEPWR